MAATDRIRISVPPRNKSYQGLTGVTGLYSWNSSSRTFWVRTNSGSWTYYSATSTVATDWDNEVVELTLSSDITAGTAIEIYNY